MIKEYYKFIKDYLKLAELKPSYVIINIISAFFYKGFSLLLPLIGSMIIKYLTIGDAKMSYSYLWIFLICYLLYYFSLFINYKVYGFNMNYSYNVIVDKIFNKVINVDNNFTRFISRGRFLNCINSDINKIGDMNDEISEMVTGVFQVLAVIIIVFIYNFYIGIIFLIFMFIHVILRNNFDRKVNIYHNKVQVQDDKYSTLLTQIISGLQEIKTFNMLEKLITKLNIIQKRFIKNYSIKRKYYTARDNDIKIVTYIFRFILYIILISLTFKNKIDVSVLILIISYHEYLVTYINDLISSTSSIREVNISVQRINDILDYKSEEIVVGEKEKDDIFGSIEFKNVTLSINKEDILKNINLKINHNEVIAIVGEAGSGKTMLINLLLRLFKPSKGKILLDNNDIYDFSKTSYSKNISVVNQKPFIFNMSIKKNLDFVSKDVFKQIEACKRARIHDFIKTLPNGYNTILRENGSNISGGQKQMISIARTILTDAEILLFDDITTSLDPDTAKLVPDLIKELKKDHTLIIVTKKPDLMKHADRIVVLNKGKIDEIGTHNKLIKTNEIYQNLQSRKSPSKIGVFNND